MAKQILFGNDGRQKLTAGMQTLAKAVSVACRRPYE